MNERQIVHIRISESEAGIASRDSNQDSNQESRDSPVSAPETPTSSKGDTANVRRSLPIKAKAIPVRMSIVSPEGKSFVPLGRSSEFPIGFGEQVSSELYLDKKVHCYFDGNGEISLPTQTPLELQLSKGLRYRPRQQTWQGKSGQLTFRLSLEKDRHSCFWDDNWITGDARIHFCEPHSAWLGAAAEDIQVANLLLTERNIPSFDGHQYQHIDHLEAYSGNTPLLEKNGHVVSVNTFHQHAVLGHLALLHTHRPIFPLRSGFELSSSNESTSTFGTHWSLVDWCDQAHRKNGFTVWCNANRFQNNQRLSEGVVAAILQKIDFIEFDSFDYKEPFLPFWYAILNSGCCLGIIGSSARSNNCTPIGAMRTYAYCPFKELSIYERWVHGLQHGATFVTNGPLLDLTINGHSPGSTILLKENSPSDSPLSVRIKLIAYLPKGTERLELIVNGQIYKQFKASPENRWIEKEEEVPILENSWVAARCWSTESVSPYPQQPIFAHTSPIYIKTPQQKWAYDKKAIASLMKIIGETRFYLESIASWNDQIPNESLKSLNKPRIQGSLNYLEQAKKTLEDRLIQAP